MDHSEKYMGVLYDMHNDQLLINKANKISERLSSFPLNLDLRSLLQDLFVAREALLNACLKDIRENGQHTLTRNEARENLQNIFNRLRLFLADET